MLLFIGSAFALNILLMQKSRMLKSPVESYSATFILPLAYSIRKGVQIP